MNEYDETIEDNRNYVRGCVRRRCITRVVCPTIVRRRARRPERGRGHYGVTAMQGRRSRRSTPVDQRRFRPGNQ